MTDTQELPKVEESKESPVEVKETCETCEKPSTVTPTIYFVADVNERPFKCVLDTPCPEQTAKSLPDDYEVNNWVLNHLPFRSEEQRADFTKKLLLDQTVKEKKEKKQKKKKGSKTMPKLSRESSTRKLPDFSTRGSVKDITKHLFKDHESDTTKG